MFPFYPRKTAKKEEKNRKGDQTETKSSIFYKQFIRKDLERTKKWCAHKDSNLGPYD